MLSNGLMLMGWSIPPPPLCSPSVEEEEAISVHPVLLFTPIHTTFFLSVFLSGLETNKSSCDFYMSVLHSFLIALYESLYIH